MSFGKRFLTPAPLCVGLVLLLGIPSAFLLLLPDPPITFENYRRLKHGMTRAEVESILGGPSGDYGGGHRKYVISGCEGWTCDVLYDWKYRPQTPPTAEEIAEAERNGVAIWWGREDAIAVQFSGEGKVIAIGCGRAWRERTRWDDLREWCGW
jgi:hypothetical protein